MASSMMPPSSLHISPYLARLILSCGISGLSTLFRSAQASGPRINMRPMCETSNTPALDLTAPGLIQDAGVLHGHVPTPEGHHAPAKGCVNVV